MVAVWPPSYQSRLSTRNVPKAFATSDATEERCSLPVYYGLDIIQGVTELSDSYHVCFN